MVRNNRRLFYNILVLLLPMVGAQAQTGKLQTFPLASVRLLDGPFLQAQQTDKKYMLAMDPDRLLAPFQREAGLEPKNTSYGNWENTGLDGHIGGHYLSALANMYAATGDADVKARLTYMLLELEKCQQANGDGYIGGVPGGKAIWKDIAAGKIKAASFSLNDKWVPLYNIHKTYAGLIDAYRLTGNEKAKSMLLKFAEWAYRLTAGLSDEQIQELLLSEYGGLNEVFADVAENSGEERYLKLSRQFSQRLILDPLLKRKDVLTGMHANTQIPKVIGYMRIAELTGDSAWAGAADFFWKTVVNKRTVSIGGNSVREHFHPVDNFSSMVESREGPETCNSYNMLKLSKQLFLNHHTAPYMDYYERTVYNHILSSQHPDGGFVYFTPMRPGHYRVYSQPHEGFWCCVGSGLENHGKYGELIYAHQDKSLYVNLFMASELIWKEQGLKLVQQTTFPESENSNITLTLDKPAEFTVHFRYPSWVAREKMKLSINGKEQQLTKDSASYVRIKRKWKTGDRINLTLPMHTQAEFLPDQSDWVSFVHGPVVLAAATGNNDMTGLKADGSRMGHIASGPLMSLDEAPLIVSSKAALVKGLVKSKKGPLIFQAPSLIHQQKYKDLDLVPFYKLHDTRYTIYWPYTSPDRLDGLLSAVKKRETAAAALEAQTVDQVNTGQQQPESDHQFKSENAENGLFMERHFRTGKGWFSYVLRNPKGLAKKLRLTYFGAEKGRKFDIFINNVLISHVELDGTKGRAFVDVDYQLPAGLNAKELEVKLVAKEKSAIANVFDVRLMK
jgi:DUF1680 family protein